MDTITDNDQPLALVVDDEPLILMDMADIIGDEGFTVLKANCADEALRVIEENPSLQLVFTDVQMPGRLNGFELARIVAERWPEMCVVVASGAAVPRETDLPDKACFVPKPVSAAVFHAVLDTHCRFRG